MKINQKLSICLIAGLVMILAVGLIRPVGAATATATQRMSFRSIGAQDGFIWESSEDNNKGYKLNSDHPTLNVDDDNIDRQYRAILVRYIPVTGHSGDHMGKNKSTTQENGWVDRLQLCRLGGEVTILWNICRAYAP